MANALDEAPKTVSEVEAEVQTPSRLTQEEALVAEFRDRRSVVAAIAKAIEAEVEGRRLSIVIYVARAVA